MIYTCKTWFRILIDGCISKNLSPKILHKAANDWHTCLKIVLVPELSGPSNRSFWTLFCSKYSGTDLLEKVVASSFDPGGLTGGMGNDNIEDMKRVDACLAKSTLQLFKKSIHNHCGFDDKTILKLLIIKYQQLMERYLSPYISFYLVLTFFLIWPIIIHPKMCIPGALHLGHLKLGKENAHQVLLVFQMHTNCIC